MAKFVIGVVLMVAGCGSFAAHEPAWPEGRPWGDYREQCFSRAVDCRTERQMMHAHKAWARGEGERVVDEVRSLRREMRVRQMQEDVRHVTERWADSARDIGRLPGR